MVDVYIGIGSNVEPRENVARAIERLKSLYPSIVFSRIFESESIGFKGDDFLNLVACFQSTDIQQNSVDDPNESALLEVIEQLKQVENEMGRSRGSKKFSDRCIDIDILLYGKEQCNSPVELPRGEIVENAYVLWPLSELAPDLRYLGSDLSYQELWSRFDKNSQSLKPIEL